MYVYPIEYDIEKGLALFESHPYRVPKDMIEDIDVWIHEFVENTVLNVLHQEGRSLWVRNPKHSWMNIGHMISSLLTLSMWTENHQDTVLTPDQFWEKLQWWR